MMVGVEVLTASDAEDRQRSLAGGLVAAGLGPGDRVALVGTPGAAMLCAVLAATRRGIIPVLTHGALLPAERAELLADAQCAAVLDNAGVDLLAGSPPAELAPVPLARPMHYTSGTTGVPKGVSSGVLSEAEGAALIAEEISQWGFGPGDRHLVCSPMYHSVSVRFAGATLAAGGTVILPGAFDAHRVVDAIAATNPNTTFMVPAHLHRLAGIGGLGHLEGFRLVVHAGAPCPEGLKHELIAAAGAGAVWEFYGSTEGQCTVCPAGDWLERPGTVGQARANRTVSVDDDGTVWCEVPRWARFQYWRRPAATAAAWRQATRDPAAFGAFTVGDLGRIDDDGYLYLDGRRHDLIITGGVNVYPAEVERTLLTAPGVVDVAVFARSDERWGQRVCAGVVGDVDLGRLDAFARANLAPHKRPKEYHCSDGLPYTATGKLRRDSVASTLGLDA